MTGVDVVAGGRTGDFLTARFVDAAGSDREIGRRLASAAASVLGAEAGPTPAEDTTLQRARRHWFAAHHPTLHERVLGAGDAFGVDGASDEWDLTRLGSFDRGVGCSAVFYPGPLTRDGRAVLARNFDFPTATLADLTGRPPRPAERPLGADVWIVRTRPADGHAAVVVGIMDVMGGMDGVNDVGLAVTLLADNESPTPEPTFRPQVGLSEQQVVRFVLETCATALEARHALLLAKHYYLFVPCHFLVADRSGDSFVFEHSPGHNHERIVDGTTDRPLVCTNHLLHRWPDESQLPTSSQVERTAAFTYRRWRTLSRPRSTDAVDRDVARHRLDEVSFRAPELGVRTLWQAVYDLERPSVELSFFLRDQDGASLFSDSLRFAVDPAAVPAPRSTTPRTTSPGPSAGLDVDRARRDTPGVGRVAHLNNAGAALPPTPVTDAVIEHLRLEAAIGGYEAAEKAADRVEATYTTIARLIGCHIDEVAVLENATRAWDMAFYGLTFHPGDRILTTRAEYASNVIALLQVAARTGAVVEVVEDDEHGQVSLADLGRRLEDQAAGPVRLIALTHVPTQGGLVNPAEAVGVLARQAEVPYLLDACQSVGQLPVDVERIGCDMLTATGRKFLRGPRGTGFLYVRRSMLDRIEPPFLDLHAATWTAPDRYELRADARRFENWETNYAAKIGLGVAVDYALSWGLDAIEERVTTLARSLRERLHSVDGVRVHDQGQRMCGIVTFTVDGVPAQDVQAQLSTAGVNTSVSLVDYARLDLPHRGLPDIVRASVHYYNTEQELDRLVQALPAAHGRTAASSAPGQSRS